jgi:hypothetical protein
MILFGFGAALLDFISPFTLSSCWVCFALYKSGVTSCFCYSHVQSKLIRQQQWPPWKKQRVQPPWGSAWQWHFEAIACKVCMPKFPQFKGVLLLDLRLDCRTTQPYSCSTRFSRQTCSSKKRPRVLRVFFFCNKKIKLES